MLFQIKIFYFTFIKFKMHNHQLLYYKQKTKIKELGL